MKSLAALLTASLLAATASAADAPAAPKVDLAKGGASYAAVCVACHAADGNSTVPLQPKLAQQHPEYLVKQMLEFKSGTRQDPIMQGFAAALSEEDTRNIAWWLASQKVKPAFPRSTLAWRASSPTTPPSSWWPFAMARARTTCR